MKYDDTLDKLDAISRKFETYNDYPKAATNNAKRAIKWKEENGTTCGTRVGWTRAGQLARRENISRDTIARMASFKRHQQHKDVPYSEGCSGLMWDAWGGTLWIVTGKLAILAIVSLLIFSRLASCPALVQPTLVPQVVPFLFPFYCPLCIIRS